MLENCDQQVNRVAIVSTMRKELCSRIFESQQSQAGIKESHLCLQNINKLNGERLPCGGEMMDSVWEDLLGERNKLETSEHCEH